MLCTRTTATLALHARRLGNALRRSTRSALGMVLAGVTGAALALLLRYLVLLFISYDPIQVQPYLRRVIRDYVSRILDRRRRSPAAARDLRRDFASFPMSQNARPRHHTHPESAQNRLTAVQMTDSFCRSHSLIPYYFQMSVTDQNTGRAGSRSYYFSKDSDIGAAAYAPPANSAIVMIDVDYYVDMAYFLANTFLPILLYSFVPTSACHSEGEVSYTFDDTGAVTHMVAGGGSYHHRLWDYSSDCVMACTAFTMNIFKIERRTVGLHRQLIFLVPTTQWSMPWSWLAWATIEGYKIRRFNPITGVRIGDALVVRFAVQLEAGMGLHMVTGLTGSFAGVSIPAAADHRLTVAAHNGTVQLSTSTMRTVISDIPSSMSPEVLLAYHRAKTLTKSPVVFSPALSVRNYSPSFADPLDPGRPVVHAFMSPLLQPAYAIRSGISAELAAVTRRVTDLAKTSVRPLSNRTVKYMVEFVEGLAPPNRLSPEDLQQVWDRQSRPSQRRITAAAIEQARAPHDRAESFVKGEAASSANDPRLITTVNGFDKISYSTIIYAFNAAVMHDQRWYAFSKTPLEIAERVAEISVDAVVEAGPEAFVEIGDFSRMDGNKDENARLLDKMLLRRVFVEELHEYVLKTYDAHHHRKGVTKNGVRYPTGDSTLSGGADTSDFNTVLNAFISYLAFRQMGSTHNEAMGKLGLYGGDDSYTGNLEVAYHVAAAAEMGQTLEPLIRRRGQTTNFLARNYSPDVWEGSPNSCCDLVRQLSKLHVTPSVPGSVKPVDKLVQKARSFLLSDANTPLLGPYCTKVRLLVGSKTYLTDRAVARWYDQVPKEYQYPNVYEHWMLDEFLEQVPSFDVKAFKSWIASAEKLEDLLRCPVFADIPEVKGKPGYLVEDGDDVISTGPCDWSSISATTPVNSGLPKPAAAAAACALPAAEAAPPGTVAPNLGRRPSRKERRAAASKEPPK